MSIFDLFGGAGESCQLIFDQQHIQQPASFQNDILEQLGKSLMRQVISNKPLFHCARSMIEYEEQTLGIKF